MQKSLKKSFFKMNNTGSDQNSTSSTSEKVNGQSSEATVSRDQDAVSHDQDAMSHDQPVQDTANGEVMTSGEKESGGDPAGVTGKLTNAEKLASYAFKATS